SQFWQIDASLTSRRQRRRVFPATQFVPVEKKFSHLYPSVLASSLAPRICLPSQPGARGLAQSRTLRVPPTAAGQRASVLDCGGPPPLLTCSCKKWRCAHFLHGALQTRHRARISFSLRRRMTEALDQIFVNLLHWLVDFVPAGWMRDLVSAALSIAA